MKILIIVNNDVDTDPRVLNQWYALKDYAEIHFMANSVKNINHATFFDFASITRRYAFHYHYPKLIRKIITLLIMLLKIVLRFFAKFKYSNPHQRRYWQYVKFNKLKKIKHQYTYDYIISNDIDTLPIAVYLKKESTQLIFDAHEYFLDEDNDTYWIQKEQPYRKYLIDNYLKNVDVFMTVGDNIAERFQKELNLNNKPIVVYNAKPYFDSQPLPVNPDKIQMVHHGVALPNRNLEALIQVTQKLPPNFELHLYLKKIDDAYYTSFLQKYKNLDRVFIHDAIPFYDIIPTISQHDIGIFLMNNTNYNSANCLPNKFFEFTQAKLMLVMTPMYEIQKIIQVYNNGIIVQPDIDMIVDSIKNFTSERILEHKKNSLLAAKSLSAEKEWQKIRKCANIQEQKNA